MVKSHEVDECNIEDNPEHLIEGEVIYGNRQCVDFDEIFKSGLMPTSCS